MALRFLTSTLLIAACSPIASGATFNAAAKTNVAVYYGQGPNQKPLTTYCTDPSIDIIILSFVNLFPQQANGFPGINFGNQCSGKTYPGPGYNGTRPRPATDHLQVCPDLQRALASCRAKRPDAKILLSLGGGTADYQLTGARDGEAFADTLWAMFGPRQKNTKLPRPLDNGSAAFAVDGFDLDIEHPSLDKAAGYKALVKRLRALYAREKGTYYLTASPQCVVPDANMAEILKATSFDMVFVQFYNTPQCSARRWVDSHPSSSKPSTSSDGGFTFDAWTAFLSSAGSKNARVYIGLPGSAAAAGGPGNDVTAAQAADLARAFYCRPAFGGVAIWEATYAAANVVKGRNFYQGVKDGLLGVGKGAKCK
ncbi:glycoside hydrolase superfamily [Camillea tinctor]|nr:glycoside hydrolase superfamily [Camillea tinctor]